MRLPRYVVHTGTKPLGYRAGSCVGPEQRLRWHPQPALRTAASRSAQSLFIVMSGVCRRMAAKEQTHLMTTCMLPLFWSGTWPRTLWTCRIRGGERPFGRPTIRWSGGKSRKHPCLCGWEGGRELGEVGTWDQEGVRRGVGGSEAGPLATTAAFSIGTGARQFVPPSPSGSPVDDVDAAERTRKTGRGVCWRRRDPCSDLDLPHVNKPQHHTSLVPRSAADLPWSLARNLFASSGGCPTTTTTSLAAGPSSGKRLH
jgi:hypothetical protein